MIDLVGSGSSSPLSPALLDSIIRATYDSSKWRFASCFFRHLEAATSRPFRPGVLWISPHQFAANLRIEPLPESRQIRRRLHGAMVRGEQVDDERRLAFAYAGRFAHAEEVLQAGCNPGRLAVFIVNLRLPSAL